MIIKINNNKFKVKVASSGEQQRVGMMKKRFDDTFNGMLFLQGSGNHCFWMKNCITDLDIIFLDNGVISKIFHSCPPCNDECTESYCSEGDLVLELQGGTCKKLQIEEGDRLFMY